jgi:ParB-like chromosome segregation protein Spo0J
MNIVEKRLNELKPYENNPRINDGAVKFVKNSIEEFGFKVPIVIDKNGTIVAGHTRYKASQELGLETVPCVVADEQVKAFRIADNKTAEKASWDLDALKTEMEELEEIDGIDMRDFGFGDFEISALTGDMEAEGYDNELMDAFSEHSKEMLKKQLNQYDYYRGY